jgi:hypothetical protein
MTTMVILRRVLMFGLVGAALAVTGCEVVRGSGKGGDIRFKVDKVEHPLTLSQTSFRGDGFDLAVERIFLVEARTIMGPQYWRVFAHGVVVNMRGEKLPFEELSGKFTIVGRSGKVYAAYPQTRGSRGKTGWLLQEHTQEPTHLPAGARGLIEVFAGLDGKDKADPPATFTFLDQRAGIGP